MSWTDDRVNLLKQLWGEGKTAAEIAKELGEGVTRNAVIGKAHRLKLSSRMSPIQQNNKPKRQKTEQRAPRAPKKSNRNIPVFKGKELKLHELKDRMCRWPNGDPQEPGFSFCGCPTVEGLPYCRTHAEIAYQVTSRARELNANDFNNDSGSPVELEIKTANS